MAGVKIEHELSAESAFARQLMEATLPAIRDELEQLGELACERAGEYADNETVYGGASYAGVREGRRGGGPHLADSFKFQIDGSTFPLTITIYSSASAAKVNALEYGAAPHTITANRAPMLRFPDSRTGKKVKVHSVSHPGNAPYNFMRRGLDSAIATFFRRARG